ncbi:MAG TPA: PAS domain S-box protein [Chitinophagaceae bacterium]|nr:PAS domain S-box protein [Chitinophagaceae bacterium]
MPTTPNKPTDTALRQIEETTRLIMKAALDAIVCIDDTGVITIWTPQAEKIFGWSEKEILGKLLTDTIIPNQYRDAHTKGFSNYIKTGKANLLNKLLEITALDKTGREFPVELTITPIQQGDQQFFCAFIRDITERKIAEEAIRISELRYRSLIEQASDAIMITDTQGTFLDINTSFCRNFGYEKEELIGNNISIVIDAQQLNNEPIRFDLLIAGQNIVRERKMLHKNGYVIEVEANVKMLPDGRILAIARDITERKKANAIIEASEKKLRQVLASMRDNFYVIDRDYNVILINEMAEKNLERSWGVPVKVGTHILPIIKNKKDEPIQESFERVFRGERVEYELRHQQKDLPAWVLVSFMPVNDEKGGITGAYVIAQDITERKESAELVLKERDLSDSIINSLPGIFYLFDEAGNYIRWNKNFASISGYSDDEMAKHRSTDYVSPADKEKVRQAIEKVFKEGYSSVEAVLVTKSGTELHYYVTGILVNYEDKRCLLGTGIDISALKKAEKELRESEQKYKLLFESNPLPMWAFSRTDLSIIDVNDAAISHYGYSQKEFLSMKMTNLRPAEDLASFLDRVADPIVGNRNLGVWKHKKKDGTVIMVEINGHDIIYNGIPARLVLANDVTEKLEAEQKLKHSFKEIRMLTEHLQQIREQERTNIAREIHDELGQQLTVLKMDASWLTKKLSSSDESIREKLKDLMQLLDGTVRSVRRISAELRPSLLDDLGLVAAIEWHLQEFEKRSGILIQFQVEEPDMPVPDELKTGLYRIFQESLTNVARHANATEVTVILASHGGNIVLSIEDNGGGFDRLKASGKKTLGILGMEERTSMMGGNYKITSSPGKGTIVTVSVPSSPAEKI